MNKKSDSKIEKASSGGYRSKQNRRLGMRNYIIQ